MIFDVGVVGVPHEETDEAPRAYVVLKTPSDDPVTLDRTREEINEHVRKHLGYFKQLRGGIRFIDKLPRTNTGKVMRRALMNLSA